MNAANTNFGSARAENSAPRLPYRPALDGLRAIAVLSVLLYHAGQTWIPGGFLGVEMFFVISGYLITSLLLAEWMQDGHIDFKSFWLRRALRLFPALFVLLLVLVGWMVVFLPGEVAALRGDVLSTAGYVNNWYQVFSHKSYFESVGRPSLLRHMWSLAVEEQFYLVWPLVFALLMARLRPRLAVAAIMLAGVASAVLMALLYHPNTDPSRVYYGTDTRAAGLLLGVALAFLWTPVQKASQTRSVILDGVGFTALAALIICFALLNEFQPFLYRGGFTLTGLATAVLLAVAVHVRARMIPFLLSWWPLRWIGLRSYGIYLWHFPVFMLTRPQLDVPLDGFLLLSVRFVLTLGIAAFSYRWVETPVRSGTLGRGWKAWRMAQGDERRRLGRWWAISSLSVLIVCLTLGVFLIIARPPAPPKYLVRSKPAVKTSGPPPVVKTNLSVTVKTSPQMTNADTLVTAIGDSVMEGVAGELQSAFGTNTVVDADQGRLPWNTPAIVRNLHAANKIHATVILHIGNNGFLSAEVFHQIMAEFKDARQVVVVNLKVPRPWEFLNNRMLASAVKEYPRAVLLDWHAASYERPRLFWKDGIHLRAEGAKVYVDLITQLVKVPKMLNLPAAGARQPIPVNVPASAGMRQKH